MKKKNIKNKIKYNQKRYKLENKDKQRNNKIKYFSKSLKEIIL